MSEVAPAPGWWESFYEDTPCELLLRRDDRKALNTTVNFLRDKLHISPGLTVLDQCCGIGSLSVPLAKRGLNVIGIDLCEKHIRMSESEAEDQHAACSFVVADAFKFIAEPPCDAGFNWWTSFGYSDNDARNLLMLQNAFRSLKPGGRFALDYPNMANIIRNGCSTTQHEYSDQNGVITMTRETTINLDKGLRQQKWISTWPDGRSRSHDTSIRLYMPHMLADLFTEAGFDSIELFGSTGGEPVSLDSERCICVGQRPTL